MRMSQGVKEHLLHFDDEYSPEIMEFATNTALSTSKYMFVTTVKKQQYGYCTHCNQESPTHLPKPSDRAIAELEMSGCPEAMFLDEEYERKKHGEKIKCPNCGSECNVRYAGLGHSKLRDYAYFVYYEKSRLDPKMIVARGIFAKRDYSQSYKKIKTQLYTEVFYTFEYKKGGKMVKPIHTSWSEPVHLGFSKTVHSWSNNHPYSLNCYSRESIKKAVGNTPFAWSGWEAYDYKEMAGFFDSYSRYPVIEYLNKLGIKEIVREKIESGSVSYNVINWKGKTIESVLKLTKEEYSIIKQQKIKIDSWFLNLIRANKERGLGLSIPEVKILSDHLRGEGEIDDIKNTIGKYMSFREAFKYCLKQNNKSRAYYSLYMVARDWKDYVSECKKLNIDISDIRVLFPNDLHTAHQNTTSQIKYMEDAALTEKIKARLPMLSNYNYQWNGLMIRPAESAFELIEEGKALNHCVGRYSKEYSEGKTNILFIRKEEEPDKPFFTMEIKENQIIQTRGLKNCIPDEVVTAFIEAFKGKKLTPKKKREKIKIAVPA